MSEKSDYETLLKYRENVIETESLQSELRFWDERLSFLKKINSSQSKCEDIEKIINSIIDELQALLDGCIACRNRCLQIIDDIEDSTERQILTMRYLNGWGFEEISKKMNYCRRHTQRIHNKAIKNLFLQA